MTERLPVEKARSDDESADRAPPSLLAALQPGAVIDGRYRVERVIGRGGMGVVVRAVHLQLQEPVALKVLSLDLAAGRLDGAKARFRREAQVSAKLRNEHIAKVMDVGEFGDIAMYMAMELLEGDELGQLLREHGRLPIEEAVRYVVQVCEGLAEAHARGVVHRDLKPSNLFIVQRHDRTELVKILDFGVSKWAEGERGEGLTESGVVLGTPKYMAPEQLFRADGVDARADVWSLGAITFALLTGRSPFDEPSLPKLCAEIGRGVPPPRLRTLLPEAPLALDEALAHCLALDPDARTQNVAELAEELLAAIGDPSAPSIRTKLAAVLATAPVGFTSERRAALRSLEADRSIERPFDVSSRSLETTGGRNLPPPPSTPPAAPTTRRVLVAMGGTLLLASVVVGISLMRGGGGRISQRGDVESARNPGNGAHSPVAASVAGSTLPSSVPTLSPTIVVSAVAPDAPASAKSPPPAAPSAATTAATPRVASKSAPAASATAPSTVASVVAPAPVASTSAARPNPLGERE